MKQYFLFFSLGVIVAIEGCGTEPKASHGQTANSKQQAAKPVGSGCDGCELMYIDMPANMDAVDTSAGWNEPGQKLIVKGRALKRDGKTSAADVIIYYWQTDNNGYYSPTKDMNEKAKRHGHIRGWVKTDARGQYAIYTIRPAPYPRTNNQAHIHISIKEPQIANEYYIDEFVFDDDKFLTEDKRRHQENRGGSGILKTSMSGNVQVAEHNIILGLNIPDYQTGRP